MTFSAEHEAWEAGDGIWYKVEETPAWRVVQYIVRPDGHPAPAYTFKAVYPTKEEAIDDAKMMAQILSKNRAKESSE